MAFAFAALIDVTAHVLDLNRIVRGLDGLKESVEYGLESVNVWAFAGDVRARLADRYHYKVWSLRAPFNLSIACRGTPSDSVSDLCKTRVIDIRDLRKSNLPPSIIPFVVPRVPTGEVDEEAYPRRIWLEGPLGLPDGVKHAFECGWAGRIPCTSELQAATAPSNWFGKGMLVVIVLLSIAAAAPEGRSDWSPGRFIVMFAGGLLVATIVASGMLMIIQLLASFGRGVLSLSSVVVSLGAFPPLLWGLHALKDVASDSAKGALGRIAPPADS